MAPGPDVAMHTPSWPVNFAWAQAMNAAISSCRVWTNRSRSRERRNALRSPLMPSPG